MMWSYSAVCEYGITPLANVGKHYEIIVRAFIDVNGSVRVRVCVYVHIHLCVCECVLAYLFVRACVCMCACLFKN